MRYLVNIKVNNAVIAFARFNNEEEAINKANQWFDAITNGKVELIDTASLA